MKSSLDHLPDRQQRELETITSHLLRGFEAAVAGGTQPWRRNAKILKIILFGSYARGDFVDEPQNGYQSDFDILVVVSDEKFTDIADYWWETEQKILHDPDIGRIVNLIVHDFSDVNKALEQGRFFFSEIVRDGVALYDAPGHAFARNRKLSAADVLRASADYKGWALSAADAMLKTAAFQVEGGTSDRSLRRAAAFTLHQAVEKAYVALLLTRTLYSPRSHNIKFLRSLVEDHEPSLVEAWPRERREDRRRFELLKRAYVEARYSDQYEIGLEDLGWLSERAQRLRDLVDRAAQAHIDHLEAAALEPPAADAVLT